MKFYVVTVQTGAVPCFPGLLTDQLARIWASAFDHCASAADSADIAGPIPAGDVWPSNLKFFNQRFHLLGGFQQNSCRRRGFLAHRRIGLGQLFKFNNCPFHLFDLMHLIPGGDSNGLPPLRRPWKCGRQHRSSRCPAR